MIDLLLVDDHQLVRNGIRRLLEDVPGIRVVEEVASGEEALAAARRVRPHVVLMDLNMPGMGGLEATRKLSHLEPGIKVIVCTVHTEQSFPPRLLEVGAAGYLTKDCGLNEIVQAIRTVSRGERYVCADMAQRIVLARSEAQGSPFACLSRREMQIMLMVTRGCTAQEISKRLCLSPKTISTYRHRLFGKLGVDNDVELTRLVLHHRVLDGDGPALAVE